MLYYFTEVSKYIIIGIMILYLLECVFYEITGENYAHCRGISARQRIYLFVFQMVCYLTICLKTGRLDYLFFCFFTQIVLFAVIILSGIIYPRIDRVLLNNMAFLLSIGFIILSRLSFNRALKQFAIVTVSLAFGIAIPTILSKIKNLSKWGYFYAVAGIIPLAIVLLLGATTHGSKLSYSIGGITIQPSEIVKIIFVFCVAALLAKGKTLFDIFIATIIAACHVLILVISRDLGSGLIFFVTYLFMLFISTRSYILFILGWLSGAGASVVAYKLFSHVQVRVKAFMDPFSVIDNEGYQIAQALFAIGCGSFFGMGLNKGAPGDIPYVESDFIFSAISEEFGAIFGVCMLLICLSCFLIMMRSSMVCNKKFYRLIACGFGVLYIFQVFLTVGGGIKFIPLTGVTLPFVSYGGSSVLSSVIVFYTVQWVIITYRDKEYKELVRQRRAERRYNDNYDRYEDVAGRDEYIDDYNDEYYSEYAYEDEYYPDEYFEEPGEFDEYYEQEVTTQGGRYYE